MSITTFSQLIAASASRKNFLVEVEPSELLESWTLYSGSIYYVDVGRYHVLSVEEDGSALTEVATLAAVSAGEWFHDGATGYLYMQASSGSIFAKVVVANYRLYFCSAVATDGAGTVFDDRYYEPFVAATPPVRQKKNDFFWGVSVVSDGAVSLLNHAGYFDDIYSRFAWSNRPIQVLLGGEDLPYSEYATVFKGIVFSKHIGTDLLDLAFVDKKYDLSDSLVANTFTEAAYPYIETANVGRPIPMVWGTVYRSPAVCTNGKQVTATSFSFKFADVTIAAVVELSRVYVNGNYVAYASVDLSTGTFTLSSDDFAVGDSVTVDCKGYTSSGLVENPVEILKAVLARHGIAYNATNFDTTAVAQAVIDAADFPCGLVVTVPMPVQNIVSDLMRSCMGTLVSGNDGRFSVTIWDTATPDSPVLISEVEISKGTFSGTGRLDMVNKTVRTGWAKNWETGEYRYSQVSSSTAERVYGTRKSRTIPTLLSTVSGAEVYAGRAILILESEETEFRFTSGIRLSDHDIGDRFAIAFKRREQDENFIWADEQVVEIQQIEKDFDKSTIRVVARGLKEAEFAAGEWTADSPTFPATLGAGSMTPWSSAWSAEQKAYAKANAGYWTDADGMADPADSDSRMISRWW